MVDAHVHRALNGPGPDPAGQVVGAVVGFPDLVQNPTADHAEEGAGAGELVQVVVEPDVLRSDLSRLKVTAEGRRGLGREVTGAGQSGCHHAALHGSAPG